LSSSRRIDPADRPADRPPHRPTAHPARPGPARPDPARPDPGRAHDRIRSWADYASCSV